MFIEHIMSNNKLITNVEDKKFENDRNTRVITVVLKFPFAISSKTIIRVFRYNSICFNTWQASWVCWWFMRTTACVHQNHKSFLCMFHICYLCSLSSVLTMYFKRHVMKLMKKKTISFVSYSINFLLPCCFFQSNTI